MDFPKILMKNATHDDQYFYIFWLIFSKYFKISMIPLKSLWKMTKNDMQHQYFKKIGDRAFQVLNYLEQIPHAFSVSSEFPWLSCISKKLLLFDWKSITFKFLDNFTGWFLLLGRIFTNFWQSLQKSLRFENCKQIVTIAQL